MSSLRLDVSRGGGGSPRCNIRGYGHSIAQGFNATRMGVTDMYPRLFSYLDPVQYTGTYTGHSGNWTYEMLGLASGDVDPFIDTTAVNIFLYIEVINSVSFYFSVGFGGSVPSVIATQVIKDHRAMFLGRRAAGFQYVVAYTMYAIYGNSSLFYQALALVNQGLRDMQTEGVIDVIVDLATDPRFAVTGPAGTVPYVADGIHPTDAGHQVIADLTLPVVRALYEGATGNTHVFRPTDIGNCLWWYEADVSWLVKDGSNNVSTLKDRSSWVFDLTAAGALRPVYNPSNAAFGNQPTIDAVSATMGTALSLNPSFAQTLQVINLYKCTSSNTIVCEYSANAPTHTDAFQITSGPPTINATGNVGLSRAIASAVTVPQSISFILDNTVSTSQCNILVEALTAPGISRLDAPNTNVLGTYPLFMFGRSGGSLPSTMSLAASLAFYKKLSVPELASVLNYLKGKWPH